MKCPVMEYRSMRACEMVNQFPHAVASYGDCIVFIHGAVASTSKVVDGNYTNT
jgi:hypothetical protein